MVDRGEGAVVLVVGDQAFLGAEGYTWQQAKRRLAGDIRTTDVDAWLSNIRALMRGGCWT